MEWKIGEIRQVNGEWYQCIEQAGCHGCAFSNGIVCTFKGTIHCFIRSDGKSVSFKKLEKVGEPYSYNGIVIQKYKIENTSITISSNRFIYLNGPERTIGIEIKQTKEDMEEKELNLKPFDLQKAKEGKPVCTRDGRKARIICFDVKGNFPIAVAVAELEEDTEIIYTYPLNGRARLKGNQNHSLDLMMLPERKEGWVNLYKSSVRSTKEEAMKYRNKCDDYIDTIKIEWEE